ncbi:prenylcysteine oxidase-like [Brachionus plicatilis]|uniref:Prenylcysteine oxidase-like n=1 Tax=Brachionus plicatilis TaxID=10195 RepID=A0A3M7SA64_BRAPC|nr:prenylcysteine oxidase-like [Brachionus plicatilis]
MFFAQMPNSSEYESIVKQYAPILNDQIQVINNLSKKEIIRIAILGAGIGGCSTAYFLEDFFNAMNEKQVKIDIYEKESELGKSPSKFNYNRFTYELNPFKLNESENYMRYFALNSGCKLSNDVDEKILTALFDSNGILVQKYGQFNKLENLKIFILKFGIRNLIKVLKIIFNFFKYNSEIYILQDNGYTFDSVEKFVRKIDPFIFTISQKSFSEQIKRYKTKFLNDLSNLACMENIGQSNQVPGIVGFHSLATFFNSSFIKSDKKSVLKFLLKNSLRTKLYLNQHVKKVTLDPRNSYEKNLIVYTKNSREYKRTYDYVIVTFPLTKNIYKENFSLDILYRDFLDCELVAFYSYIIDGVFSMLSPRENQQLFKLYTNDQSLKFCSVKTLSPIESGGPILYSVSSYKDLNDNVLDSLFDKGWKLIKKINHKVAPLYKKVRYSHTPFPQIVIDDKTRSRVFYLNGIQWFTCSKESSCISAKNVAMLIIKHVFEIVVDNARTHTDQNISIDFFRLKPGGQCPYDQLKWVDDLKNELILECFFEDGPLNGKISEAQRLQIFGLLKDKIKSQQEIADLVGASRKCVITTKRNYEKTSVVKELTRSARPRKLTSRDESYVFRKPHGIQETNPAEKFLNCIF